MRFFLNKQNNLVFTLPSHSLLTLFRNKTCLSKICFLIKNFIYFFFFDTWTRGTTKPLSKKSLFLHRGLFFTAILVLPILLTISDYCSLKWPAFFLKICGNICGLQVYIHKFADLSSSFLFLTSSVNGFYIFYVK